MHRTTVRENEKSARLSLHGAVHFGPQEYHNRLAQDHCDVPLGLEEVHVIAFMTAVRSPYPRALSSSSIFSCVVLVCILLEDHDCIEGAHVLVVFLRSL